MGMIAYYTNLWGDLAMVALGAFVIGWVLFMAFMAVFRTTFNVLRNNPFARNYGRLTQFKADSLSEKQARQIYGDREVDRFLQYGDYDPPNDHQIHPHR